MVRPESYLPLMSFPFRRDSASLIVSIALHLAVALMAMMPVIPARSPRIEVRLPQLVEAPTERLLKNTYENSAGDSTAILNRSINGRRRANADAQQRLAAQVFYPAEAVKQGLEGEVRLLLLMDGKGKLLDVRVASSSGHALLDKAALDAARAAGTFAGAGSELILPVIFRLSE